MRARYLVQVGDRFPETHRAAFDRGAASVEVDIDRRLGAGFRDGKNQMTIRWDVAEKADFAGHVHLRKNRLCALDGLSAP